MAYGTLTIPQVFKIYGPGNQYVTCAKQLVNKEGVAIWKFKPGLHSIAVKAVDTEGLEAVEVVKLKVNGAVERK